LGLSYPQILVDLLGGNNTYDGSWLGIKCNGDGKVKMVILNNFNLSGTLSLFIGKLDSLFGIRLGGNDISGRIPSNWISLNHNWLYIIELLSTLNRVVIETSEPICECEEL